ncbi:Uncharacterised protein [uncultured archaeon]|nr:Uncharacterised protein [uncultured archaeon]
MAFELVSAESGPEDSSPQKMYLQFKGNALENRFALVFPYYLLRCAVLGTKEKGTLFVAPGIFVDRPNELTAIGWRGSTQAGQRDFDFLHGNLGMVVLPSGKDLEHLSKGDLVLTCPSNSTLTQYSFIKYSN